MVTAQINVRSSNMEAKHEISEAVLYQHVAKIPSSLNGNKFNEYYPEPTSEAIDIGVMTRYFIRQSNHQTGYITEIDSSTYTEFKLNKLYTVLELPWRIRGRLDDEFKPSMIGKPIRLYTGVKTANELTLKDAEAQMPGITRQLGNLMQFWVGP